MRTTRHTTTTAAAGALLLGSVLLAGPAAAQDDQNCFFSSQAGAQEAYRSLVLGQDYIGPTDAQGPITTPDQFDPDQDGVACEDYTGPWAPSDDDEDRRDEVPVPLPNEAAPTEEPQMVTPEGSVAAGGGGTSGVENTSLIAAGGIALTIGAGGMILAARRNRA